VGNHVIATALSPASRAPVCFLHETGAASADALLPLPKVFHPLRGLNKVRPQGGYRLAAGKISSGASRISS